VLQLSISKENNHKALSIELCSERNIKSVMHFIANEWSSNHILANDLPMLTWQYGSKLGGFNWVLGLDNDLIKGLIGFIPLSKFDEELDNEFIWLALWKVIEGNDTRGLGLKLLRVILSDMPASGYGVLGINQDHLSLYKSLGFTVGTLKQFFMINTHLEQKLIHNPYNLSLPSPRNGEAVFKLASPDFLETLVLSDEVSIPSKSPRYFANRFYAHPIYKYEVFIIQYKGLDRAIIATRVAEHCGSKVLRIVDFYGSNSILSECGNALQALMEKNNCEFCDFWQYGIYEASLNKCGLFDALSYDVSVPNYFEPFVQDTRPIFFAIKSTQNLPLRIFRADGDQDRPNFR
jgi:hypothetical protein